MASSQNGWSASPTLQLRPLVVAGEAFTPGIRDNDDVHTVLQYVAQQLHTRVEPIVREDWHQADDWGFHFKPNANNPDDLSNHASGTAYDYNATRHPNGVPTRSTWTASQVAEIHQILAEVDYAVRWGGDYSGTPDAMHFEINTNPATLHAVAEKLRDDMPKYRDWDSEDRKALAKDVADAVLSAEIGKTDKATVQQILNRVKTRLGRQ